MRHFSDQGSQGRGYSFFARTQELNESKVSARLLARSVALMVFCDSDSKTCPTRRLDRPDFSNQNLKSKQAGTDRFLCARPFSRDRTVHAAPKRWCHHLP